MESIYNLKEKTILIVSHKKETLYGCNKIFELKDAVWLMLLRNKNLFN